MADCYALEMDDLHRRWLPPEILDDIGFADGADAAPPPAAIEGLAVHLAGILGSGRRKAAPCRPPPTAAAPTSYHHQLHRVPVCGLERPVLVAYGSAAAAWPFSPYSSPAQWQVATGLVNGGGALDQRRRLGSPPAKLRGGGGTGVFLPRAEMYHAKAAAGATVTATTKPPSRDGKASKDRLVEQEEGSPATEQHQCQLMMSETASSEMTMMMQQHRPLPQNAAAVEALHHPCPELALPQEWTY
ncbi:hypothetical protein E2562_022513 [Oryza meyeriana var. granulata]|uniref:Uncharacterized protein n=1 Tax=Oryza meyeriana var. granulata TaxID=110450 RepID=A0A6G1BLP5_9ORYZ|nr:hypothetical protein E2562_022513 [Oryza meyeriana var. granulata]